VVHGQEREELDEQGELEGLEGQKHEEDYLENDIFQ
tara:strand:+ start:102 stop:209 length:108 start_codon:yes stop_codon:yes gene_type:complete